MKNDKKDAEPEVDKVNQTEGTLSDDELEAVTGGSVPQSYLDKFDSIFHKDDPDTVR